MIHGLGVGLHWTSTFAAFNLDTLLVMWLVLAFVTLTRGFKSTEVVMYLHSLTEDQALLRAFTPLVGTLFLFILACNWLGALVPVVSASLARSQ